jgi:hypothetical protein
MMTGTIGATLLSMLAGPLSVMLFGSGEYELEFRLFAFTLISNAVTAVGMSY